MRWIWLAFFLLPSAALAEVPPHVLEQFQWYEREYQPDEIKKLSDTIKARRRFLEVAKTANVVEGITTGTIKAAGKKTMHVRTYPSAEAKRKAIAKAQDDVEKTIHARELLRTTFNPKFKSDWVATVTAVDTKMNDKKTGRPARPKVVKGRAEVPVAVASYQAMWREYLASKPRR